MSNPSTTDRQEAQRHYPDPSALTTDVIHREISTITKEIAELKQSLRDDLNTRAETRQREAEAQGKLFDVQIAAIQREFMSEIAAINSATALRIKAIDGLPDLIDKELDKAVDTHEKLQLERFKAIAQQFSERDIRTDQAQRASADALAAALQAAKELVNAQSEAQSAAAVKSEVNFTKQFDAIIITIQTLEKALDSRITELKERIDRGEGSNVGQVIAAIAVLILIVGGVVSLVLAR